MPAEHLALEVDGLRFRYGDAAAWVIDVRRLAIKRGEHVLLTGRSGSGKSTLLQLIAGLIDPGEGRVSVSGQDVHQLRGAARDAFRGAHVGMIFQTFNLLQGFTAIENVQVAMMFSSIPPREHRAKAAALLERLGIERPFAFVEDLSVGQQQRVAVARAVACEPAVVLADEPTASLDPENAAGAMDLIQQVCRERNAALLCVSHDPSMAARFPRVESLDQLAIAAAGSAAAVGGRSV